MKLSLCVLSCNQALFDRTVWHAVFYANESVHVVGLGNGVELTHFGQRPPSQPGERGDLASLALDRHARTVLKLPYQDNTYRSESLRENVGVPAGLHRLYETARIDDDDPSDHVIAYLHDDLTVFERGWDVRVKRAFQRDPSVALVGFAGTHGLGARDQSSFHLSTVSRDGPMLSNMHLHAEWHGERVTEDREVAFVDGFALCLRQSFLDAIGGWSWWRGGGHHAYDAGIACMVRRHGLRTWLCPVHLDHGVADFTTHERHSGTGDAYKALSDRHGGHAAVHEASSRFVWEEFRDVLPFSVDRVSAPQPVAPRAHIPLPPPTSNPTVQLSSPPPAPSTKHARRSAARATARKAAFKKRYGAR